MRKVRYYVFGKISGEKIDKNILRKVFLQIYLKLYGLLDFNIVKIKIFTKGNLLFVSTPVECLYKVLTAFLIAYFSLTNAFPEFIGIYPTVKSALRSINQQS